MKILERLGTKPYSIIGHRGAAGLAPENTLKAVEMGIWAGADIVEVDARSTRDGKIIVFHDPDLSRLARVEKKIGDVAYEWLRGNISIGGEPIPLLEEVVEHVKGRVGLFIEVKEPRITRRVLEILEAHRILEDAAVISFFDEVLVEAKTINPRMVTGLIYSRPPGRILDAEKLGARIVLPNYRIASRKANAFAHRLGLRVVAWTINDEENMVKAYENGVDGIATDYPDKASRLRKKLLEDPA